MGFKRPAESGYDVLGWFTAAMFGGGGSGLQGALNAANAAGGGTVWAGPGTYDLSSSLVIYSNTTLLLDPDAIIRIAAGLNFNFIHNAAWVAGSGRDTNIRIQGGTWTRVDTNFSSSQAVFGILMQRVDNLYVGQMQGNMDTSTQKGRFIVTYACTNFVVEQIGLNVGGVGIQVLGACSNGRIVDIHGTVGDDGVALTPIDFTNYYNGDPGDIVDVIVENLLISNAPPSGTGASGFKAIVGLKTAVAYGCRRITARNVNWTRTSGTAGTGQAVLLGGDTADAAGQNGILDDISIDDVTIGSTGQGVSILNFGASATVTNITLSRIGSPEGANSWAISLYAGGSASTLQNLVVRDTHFVSTSGNEAVNVRKGFVVKHLLFDNCYFNIPTGLYDIRMSDTSSTITTLKLSNCRINQPQGGLINGSAGTTPVVTNLVVQNLTVDLCTHILGDIVSGMTINVWIDGMYGATVNTSMVFNRSGSTLNMRTFQGVTGAANTGKFGSTGTVNWGGVNSPVVQKAGAVSDGDFSYIPPDGVMGLDTTNHRLYIRDGGVWKYAVLL